MWLGNKTVHEYSVPVQGVIPCTGDYITGKESFVMTIWDRKVQLRGKGTFTSESGKTYSWNLVENASFKYYSERGSTNQTMIATSVVECEGVPVAVYKIRVHLTINANGEPSVDCERETDGYVCL